jgi:hypothetical protein
MKVRSFFVLILAGCFLIIYIVNFFILTSRLRRYFKNFYEQEKSRIITLNICIILSIIARMVVNNYMADPEIFDKLNASTEKDEWYGPLIIAASNLISSILPIAALLYSLLHAIEQKEEIRKTTITSKSVQEANETASLVSSSH